MLRTTFRRMYAHVGRLVAAAVAVVIAAAFVTAFLLGTHAMERSAYNAALVAQGDADVILSDSYFPARILENVRAVPEVAGADGRFMLGIVLATAGRSDSQTIAPLPQTPALRVDLSAGTYPERAGQVMVDEDVADRLGLDSGSMADVRVIEVDKNGQPVDRTIPVTVTGIFEHPGSAYADSVPAVFGFDDDVVGWAGGPANVGYQPLMAVAAPGISPEELRESLTTLANEVGGTVRTADEYAALVTSQFTDGQNLLAPVLAAFVAVALFVAGMVISNTFTVLVAQRTRELALLRCVGATRRQVRAGVLLEATALGVAASLVGILAGVGLTTMTIGLLSGRVDAEWLPSRVDVPFGLMAIPIVLGTVMTVLAAMPPARAATRVAPLAALRPPEPAAMRGTSRSRMVVCVMFLVAGGGLLGLGAVVTYLTQSPLGLAAGVLGGAISFVGVAVGAVVVVPFVVSALGRVLSVVGGVPARIATANAIRHPRRTASTTVALLIGVTLVAMMSVGAASAQATFDGELDERYPVDVAVGSQAMPPGLGDVGHPPRLEPQVIDAVADIDGLATMMRVRSWRTDVGVPDPTASTEDAFRHVDATVYGVDPADAQRVTHSGVEGLGPKTVVVPLAVATDLDVMDGDTMQFTAGQESIELTVWVSQLPETAVLVTDDVLARLAPNAPVALLWLGLDADADADAVVADMRDAISEVAGDTGAVAVTGARAERDELSTILDTMLAVVLGLLAVAVVIALIGVSNTLSLSVIERTRESATLRALGLTRRQLRAMLATEGVLIAVVGAGLGIGLGFVYGWLGTVTALGGVWDTVLSVPWGLFALMLVVAVVAGLLASVLPGRRAAKAAPVAALGAE